MEPTRTPPRRSTPPAWAEATPARAQRRRATLYRLTVAVSRNPRVVGIAGTAVAVLMIALSLTSLYQGRAEAINHARQTSVNLVSIISNDIARSVELYDLSLQAVVDGAQSPELMALSMPLRRQFLFDRATTASHLGGAYLLDAHGRVVVENDRDLPQAGEFGDRDYFSVHAANPHAGLFISRPFRSRLRDGSLSIGLSRRVNAPDGSFAGVALLALPVDYFNSVLSKIETGPHGSVFIVMRDGTMLARKPFSEGAAGANVAASPTFRTMATQASGTYTAASPIDHVRRIYTFARIPDTPFVAVVAPAEEDTVSAWRARSLVVGTLTIFLGLSFIGISWLLAYSLRERTKAQAELVRLAGTDALTGLSNRRVLDSKLAEEWSRARRSGAYLSVLFVDVDRFKSYNDTYGHNLGDEALVTVADCIEAAIRRPNDMPARYGGEEFVVLLPDTAGGAAMKVAAALRARVEGTAIEHRGSAAGVITVSIGCATASPRNGGDALALLDCADAALYRAKEGGRNRIESAACGEPSELV